MEKLLVLPSTRSKLEALKAFLAALKIEFKSVSVGDDETATITDSELLQRIADYEQGKTVPKPLSLEEITRVWDALDRPYQLCVSFEISIVPISSGIDAENVVPVDSLIAETGVAALQEASV